MPKKWFWITLITISVLVACARAAHAAGITVPADSSLRVNTALLTVPGNVANAGTVVLTSGSIKLDGNWTNSGTLTAGTGTVEFTAASVAQTVNSGGTGATKAFYHLAHTGSGALELLTNAIEINGDFTNSAGSFDTKGLSMNVAGSWSNTANFVHSSAAVTFDGTSGTPSITAAPANGTFYDLVFQATAITYTATTALTAERDLTVTSGTLDAGANTVTVSRNWDVHAANGGFVSSGEVVFNGASPQSVSTGGTNAAHDFQNLTHSGDGKLQLNASYNLTVNGALAQSGAGDFDTQGCAVTAGSLTVSSGTFNADARAGSWDCNGDVSVSGAATLTATSGAFAVGGSFSAGATFNPNNSTITFDAVSGTPSINCPPAQGSFYNLIFNDAGNNITFSLSSDLDINNNLTINGGTVNATARTLNVGGNWDNNDLFTATGSTVIFDASSTGKTVEAGASSFNTVEFNNASGGWTIQTDNLTAADAFSLTACAASNGFIVQSNRTVTVNGAFTNAVGGNATTWNSGSVLNLTMAGGGEYAINNSTAGADAYAALQVGADTDVRMWNSSAASYTVAASGSLYSMDHNGVDGELFIWGDYYVPQDTTDYWAYATDFDETPLSGSERQAKVFLAEGASVSCGPGETLRVIGTAAYPTLIDRQGASGSYAITVNDGFLRCQYYSIQHINGSGLNLLGTSTTVSNLDYGTFDNSEGSGASDAFITVTGDVITNNPAFLVSGCVFNNTSGNANFCVRATGATASFWNFSGTSGAFDGEAFDDDPGGNPGYLVWDDSAGASISISGTAFVDDNEAQTVNSGHVGLAVNDQYQTTVITNGSNGTFTFSNITVSSGDSLTLYFDGEAFKGSLVTVAGTGSISGLKMFQNHVVVRTEPVGALSINQMAKYDKDNDPDINFDAEDLATDTLVIDDGSELFIPAGKEFQPLGNLQDGTAGVWDVDNRGTFTCVAYEQIRVSGSWRNDAAATFACGESTVRFDASSGTPAISPAADAFYNLVINSSVSISAAGVLAVENDLQVTSGTLSPAANDISIGAGLIIDGGTLSAASCSLDIGGDVTLSSGTLTAPGSGKTFTIAGNWANSGAAFVSGNGTVTFDKAGGTQTVNAGGTGNDNRDFNLLAKTGSGLLQLVFTGLEVDGTLTVSGSTTLDLNGQDLNAGTLSNSGIVRMLGSEASVTIASMDTAKGEVVYAGDGDETAEVFTMKNFGSIDYYDLTINDTNTVKDTFRTGADITVNHNLQVLAGALDISFNGNTLTVNQATTVNGGDVAAAGGNIDANGSLSVLSGTLIAPAASGYFRLGQSLTLAAGTFTHSSGTLTFDAASGTPAIDSGANTLYSVVFNDGGNGITFTLSSDVTLDNDLTIAAGTLSTGSDRAVTLAGNWSNAGSFVSNNSTVTFNKASGTQTVNAGGTGSAVKDFYLLTKSGGGTLQLVSTGLEVDGTLTISATTTLDLNGQDLNAGALDNNELLQLQGNESVAVTTMDTDSGTVRYIGDGDVTQDTFTIAGFAASQFNHLTVNDSHATKDIFQTSQDVAVAGDLTIDGGSLAAASHNVSVNGSVAVASGTLSSPGTGKSLTIGKDLSVAGTFTHNSGSVVFNDNTKVSVLDAPAGGLAFSAFTCTTASKQLDFTQDDTFSVAGVFTLNGQATGTRIDLNSTAGAATTWNLILTGSYSCQYVDVQGSKATGSVTFPIDPAGSVDSGNNTNWFAIAGSNDANMLRLGADRHAFYDGAYFWLFYIDTDGNVVYKRSSDGGTWGNAVTVSSGDYSSLGIWEDDTYIWCCYSDASIAYERRITIASGAVGTEQTLTSVSTDHPQIIKSASNYLHRKAERGQWKVNKYTGTLSGSTTTSVTITPVSAFDRAFILAASGSMSAGVGSGGALQNANQVLIRARFDTAAVNRDKVILTRGNATGGSAYAFYVIEETGGSDIYVTAGSTAFTGTTDADLTVALSGITDYTKCVVFLTVSSDSGANTRYHQAHVQGWVDSGNNLQLLRTAGNSTPTVDWFVVEFKGDWSVQQGDFTVSTGIDAGPQTQAITAVDTSRSFVFMNWRVNVNGVGVDTPKVELANPTTLNFSRQTYSSGTNVCVCRWYVISHPGLRVQRGTDAAAAGDYNEDQAINAVDLKNAFPLSFNDCAGTTNSEFPAAYWNLQFSDNSTLYWDRSFLGTTQRSANFKWQVIELPHTFHWMRSTNTNDDSAWNAEAKLGEDTAGYGHCSLVPLTGSNVMALYNDYDSGTYYLRYKVYNGTTWGAEATAVSDCQDNTTFSSWSATQTFSAVSDDAGYVYLIYTDTSGNIKYSYYDGGSWSSPAAVSDNTGCSQPALTYDQTYETLYAFWLEGTDLKYKRYVRSWAAPATTLRSYLVSPAYPGCAYQDADQIAIVWQQGAASPYSVAYETMQIVPTIVDLVDFHAIGYAAKVSVSWRTASEINNAGFNLYRSLKPDEDFVRINAALVAGLGTSAAGSSYAFDDTTAVAGNTYYYILESVELGGLSRRFGPVIAHPGVDTDSDGISNDYEYFYGLDPAANDAAADPDADGLTNAQEYTAGSDPYSAAVSSLSFEAAAPGSPGITVISNDASEIVLELVTNRFDASIRPQGAVTYHRISFPEYSHSYSDDVGKPQVPVKGVLLSMPDKQPRELTVIDSEVESLASGYNLYPVPQRALVSAGGTVFLAQQFYKDALAYATDSFYPGKRAEVDYSSYLAGQNVAKIMFYPLQFNPVTGAVDFYKRLRVRLTTQPHQAQSADAGGSGVAAGTANAAKILVDRDGICRITPADLAAAGVDVAGIDPRHCKVYSRGQEIAIFVQGEDDHVFDASDYLEFYGQKLHSRFGYRNVYWLVWSQGDGKRTEDALSSAGTTPAQFLYRHHFERNESYWMEVRADDPWFFTDTIAAGATKSFSTDLIDVVNSGQTAALTASLAGYAWGASDVTHHLRFYLNDHIVSDVRWTNNDAKEVTLDVPSYWLREGSNTIKLASIIDSAADADGLVLVDWFDIDYWRSFTAADDHLEFSPSEVGTYTCALSGFTDQDIHVYDVSDPAAVKRVPVSVAAEGPSYRAVCNVSAGASSAYAAASAAASLAPAGVVAETSASSLRSSANQADYIIIACDSLAAATAELAEHRAKQGMKVVTAKLSDVYDEFNYGIPSPYAIKYFLGYAAASWKKPAPTYVLLVGDATYDFRDDEGFGFTDYLPTHFVYNPDFGETANDDWFVCLGGDGDIFPDMLLGRFPAKTAAEVTAMSSKTIAYENAALDQPWTKRAVFVADNAAMFDQVSDTLAATLSEAYTRTKLYLDEYSHPNDCKQDIISQFNQGALLVNYAGHGGVQLWAEEEIFTNDTIASLNNTGKYPVVVALNCVNGYFVYPEFFECLAEELLRADAKGAVAVLAPSGMSLPSHQQMLAQGVYDSLFKQKERILGSAVAQGKLYLFQEAADSSADTLQQFNLFGDPALVLRKEALVSPDATAPSVYTPVSRISSLYSLAFSADAMKRYPSMVFEEASEASRAQQGTDKGRAFTPKERPSGSKRGSVLDTLQARKRKAIMKEKAAQEKEQLRQANRIVRLGRANKQEQPQAPKPALSIPSAQTPPAADQKPAVVKPRGFFARIAEAVDRFFKSFSGKKEGS